MNFQNEKKNRTSIQVLRGFSARSSSALLSRSPRHVLSLPRAPLLGGPSQLRTMASHDSPQYVARPAEIPTFAYLAAAIIALPLAISGLLVPEEARYAPRQTLHTHDAHAAGHNAGHHAVTAKVVEDKHDSHAVAATAAAHGAHDAHAVAHAARVEEEEKHEDVDNSLVVVEEVHEPVKHEEEDVKHAEDDDFVLVVAEAADAEGEESQEGL